MNRAGLTPVQVCRSKVKYHTEKSAIRSSDIWSKTTGVKYSYYRCGASKHFHLTHVNLAQRVGHGNKLNQSQDKETK